jgi:menaquinone-dependent protoporphyrinogen IX oxidase
MLQTNRQPKGFDGVFYGSIHMHKYQSAMAHYITDHLAILSQIPEHFSPFPWLWHQGWKKNFWKFKNNR